MRTALASSGDPDFAREAVDLLEVGDRIEVLTTSEDAAGSKPEPDLIRVTLDLMGGVDRAVFVGDTPYDVEAANRAGIGCIGVLTGGFSAAELMEAGALMVAESPAELVDLHWPDYLARSSWASATPGDASHRRRRADQGARSSSAASPTSGAASVKSGGTDHRGAFVRHVQTTLTWPPRLSWCIASLGLGTTLVVTLGREHHAEFPARNTRGRR